MTRRTIDLTVSDLAPYTEAQVRFAVAAWPLRAAEELRSALIYRALSTAARASMPAAWLGRFNEAMNDELHHARLCAAVGQRLGAVAPSYDASRVRTRVAALQTPVRRAAALLLVEVAMGETISLSLFRAGRRTAIEPLTRAALTSIAADEARHQQLGWSGSAALWPLLAEADRDALSHEAARALAAFEQENAVPALHRLERREVFDPAHAALGVLAPAARVEAFYSAVERHVVPRLTALGIDGPTAWAHRYRRDSHPICV